MAQWGKVDRKEDSPIWAPAQVGKTQDRLQANALFNNTTSDAYITSMTVGTYAVGVDEMSDSAVGQVASVSVTAAGTGYTERPTVSFSGGGIGASGATAQATAKIVTGSTIHAGGSGYAPGDVVTINTSGAAGVTTSAKFNIATVNASASNTALTLTINTAGAFTTLPTRVANNDVTATTGSGTGLRINLAFGVLAVTMTANGTGFTSAPSVSFGGAGGSGSTATAALASEQSKVTHAGWVLRKQTIPTVGIMPSRTQYETLVAMKSISGSDTDDSLLPE